MAYAVVRDGRILAVVQTRVAASLIRRKGAKIVKTPPPAKPSPCPVCKSRSGFCVMATFVPESWWSRRSTRRFSK